MTAALVATLVAGWLGWSVAAHVAAGSPPDGPVVRGDQGRDPAPAQHNQSAVAPAIQAGAAPASVGRLAQSALPVVSSVPVERSSFAAPVASSQKYGQVSIAQAADGAVAANIDPTSTFVVGVVLRGADYRGPNIAYTQDVKLVETLSGEEVETAVQISGGADTLNVKPLGTLKSNTSYTLRIENVLDLGSLSDPDAPMRPMQDLVTSFITGAPPPRVRSNVAFDTRILLNGFGDDAAGFTSVSFGPDGRLYIGTIVGEIYRWSLKADGALDPASREVLTIDTFDAGSGERRGIIGLAFDPDDRQTIWITDNAPIPRESDSFSTPDFSGRVSRVMLGPNLSFEGATVAPYVFGLPRSGGDHLTNSLAFRRNPDAGQPGEPETLLYLTQGSNTATGRKDAAWGGRPERLLNAAVLEIDPRRTPPPGGFDVRTEPVDPGDLPTTTFPDDQFNADGTYPGMYDPFAPDAVLRIYAKGLRNAYDLVWHSNGRLYVAANSSAAGGLTPTDPTQPGLRTVIENAPKQSDYFFSIREGGYYGHPNPRLGHYILNGGNPTPELDQFEVVAGNDGNSSTEGYPVGVQPDPAYDMAGVYRLGYNLSPNGATEYKSAALGGALKGAVVFAQFSVGDTIRYLKIGPAGEITEDDVLRRANGLAIDDYIDPLDIIENPFNGALYLVTLDRSTGASQLVLMTPRPNAGQTIVRVGDRRHRRPN